MKSLRHVTREVEVLWQVLKRAIVSKRAFANQHSNSGGGGGGGVYGGKGFSYFWNVCFYNNDRSKKKN